MQGRRAPSHFGESLVLAAAVGTGTCGALREPFASLIAANMERCLLMSSTAQEQGTWWTRNRHSASLHPSSGKTEFQIFGNFCRTGWPETSRAPGRYVGQKPVAYPVCMLVIE